jgi:hypothetical protein
MSRKNESLKTRLSSLSTSCGVPCFKSGNPQSKEGADAVKFSPRFVILSEAKNPSSIQVQVKKKERFLASLGMTR